MNVEFWFDPMCPYAYQTSVWIRRVREQVPMQITWRFFSLEEINCPEGKRHPWERPLAYGWTPMRVAAWLRRQSNDWCGTFYEVCGRALHVDGRRHYERETALELMAGAGLPTEAWDEALADPTTSDEVRADHEHALLRQGATLVESTSDIVAALPLRLHPRSEPAPKPEIIAPSEPPDDTDTRALRSASSFKRRASSMPSTMPSNIGVDR